MYALIRQEGDILCDCAGFIENAVQVDTMIVSYLGQGNTYNPHTLE